MAAEPISQRELAELHERIGRDLAELRSRCRRAPAATRRPGDLITVAVEIFRVMQAAQGVVAALRQ
ncbi:MAG: hypothetical protein QN178_07105 [Armatimonadota bacterium]|nr:hypothetical protein [Armatimonadota bacterium]